MAAHFVGSLGDIPEDTCRMVRVGDVDVGVIRVKGRIFAYENRCPHQGGPVCQGRVWGRLEEVLGEGRSVVGERFSSEELHLVCPWHGFEYDAETGVCAADRRFRLKPYEVRTDGDAVYVVS